MFINSLKRLIKQKYGEESVVVETDKKLVASFPLIGAEYSDDKFAVSITHLCIANLSSHTMYAKVENGINTVFFEFLKENINTEAVEKLTGPVVFNGVVVRPNMDTADSDEPEIRIDTGHHEFKLVFCEGCLTLELVGNMAMTVVAENSKKIRVVDRRHKSVITR